MNRRLVDALLLCVLAAPLLYIWLSAAALPVQVASSFNLQGVAEGYMQRDSYLRGAMLSTVGLPIVLGLGLPALIGRTPVALISLPNRDHWLAPERRQATLNHLGLQLRIFAVALSAFLTTVQVLVVHAQQRQPPRMDTAAMPLVLGMFLVATAIWVLALSLHFRRPH